MSTEIMKIATVHASLYTDVGNLKYSDQLILQLVQ